MAVKIRLTRGGAKKRPYYRVVAADARAPRDGRFIEKLGTYNPLLAKDDPNRVKLNKERIEYWLSTGAEPSETICKFLEGAGIAKGHKTVVKYAEARNAAAKIHAVQKKEKEKLAAEKAKEEEAKAKAEAEEAAKQEAEAAAAAPAEEAPAEEPKAEEAPAEEAKAEEAPKEEAAPAEEAKAEEAPKEEAAEDKPAEEEKPAE